MGNAWSTLTAGRRIRTPARFRTRSWVPARPCPNRRQASPARRDLLAHRDRKASPARSARKDRKVNPDRLDRKDRKANPDRLDRKANEDRLDRKVPRAS